MEETVFDQIELTLFASKYCRGGEKGIHGPVSALMQPYDQDVHFACYCEPSETRLRKDLPRGNTSFRVMMFDLDKHGAERPTDADFDGLLMAAKALPNPPNWVSRGRGGCHLLYVTTEISNPLAFEVTRAAFSATLAPLSATAYQLDFSVSDFTRLWRSPRVVRADPDDETLTMVYTDIRDSRIEVFHEEVLDVGPWWSEPKPTVVKPPLEGGKIFTGRDTVIRDYLTKDHSGERNRSLFRAVCWTIKRYVAHDAAILIEKLKDRALREGLPESEIETVVRSATTAVDRERNSNVR